MTTNVLLCVAAAAVSAAVIWGMIAYAARLGLVQVPVARSSHVKPTPTGGGVGIAVGALTAVLPLSAEDPATLVLCSLAVAVAVLGLVDDRAPLPAKLRFLVQAAAVAGAIVISTAANVVFGQGHPWLVPLAFGLLLLGGLWWLNLFNFMDGIDGIAAQQALCMLVGAMLILSGSAGWLSSIWWMMGAVAAATAAFLGYNWPPARIFMGDAGSMFLAFMLLVFALVSIAAGWMVVPQWLLLAGPFAVDATMTLLVRLLRGETVTQAHRSHAYQRLSRRWGSPVPVTGGCMFLNIFCVLPLTFWLPVSPLGSYAVVLVFYAALATGCLWAGSGLPDNDKGVISNGEDDVRTP